MTISVKIIVDSVTTYGTRVTTFQCRYPRMVHSELMTHRKFSRNASSSRAIPVKKLIQDVIDDPAMPFHWGKDRPGMQAFEEIDEPVFFDHDGLGDYDEMSREGAWLYLRDKAVETAAAFARAGYHKQIINRLLEPFAHINVVITATDFNNFFALRWHDDADPSIRALADAMYLSYQASQPKKLLDSEWHLPYIRHQDWLNITTHIADSGYERVTNTNLINDAATEMAIRVSVARCARTSYTLHDGKETTVDTDMGLYDRLLASVPLHASPAEHQATPDSMAYGGYKYPTLHGNLTGVVQFRKLLPGEYQGS